MSPKLSVVIPIYRVEAYLRQCLDSIVNQTLRDIEIILIDDGSPDNCGKICDEYAAKDERIIVVHKQNEGLCAARNDGIARASGEWITFVDSDDWCEEAYYERLFEALGTQQADVFCAGGCYWEYPEGTSASQVFEEPFLFSDKEHIESLQAKVICAQCCDIGNKKIIAGPWDKIFRLAFLKQNGLIFDVSFKAWEDFWFNFQVMGKAEAVGGCPYLGYHYRQVATSITHRFNPQKAEMSYHYIEKLCTYIEEHETNQTMVWAVEMMAFGLSLDALKLCYFHPSNTKPYRELAREMRAMKARPCCQKIMHIKGTPYFSKRQWLIRCLMRMPWIWPLKLSYDINRKLREMLSR